MVRVEDDELAAHEGQEQQLPVLRAVHSDFEGVQHQVLFVHIGFSVERQGLVFGAETWNYIQNGPVIRSSGLSPGASW